MKLDFLKQADYEKALYAAIFYCEGKIKNEWTPMALQSFLMLIATVKGNQALAELLEYIEPGSEEEQLESMMNNQNT